MYVGKSYTTDPRSFSYNAHNGSNKIIEYIKARHSIHNIIITNKSISSLINILFELSLISFRSYFNNIFLISMF